MKNKKSINEFYEKTINYYIKLINAELTLMKKVKEDGFSELKNPKPEQRIIDLNLELEFYKNSDRERFFKSKIRNLEENIKNIEESIKDINIENENLTNEILAKETFLEELQKIVKRLKGK